MSFELDTELVTGDGAAPEQLLFVLHGVFGQKANWRLFMRSVAKQRPDWGFVLCDLRGHGQSQGAKPPHTLAAMVADLRRVEARFEPPVVGVVGHSLGGKVALCYAAERADALREVWILDSNPGARDRGGPSAEVLELLEGLPKAFAERSDFTSAVEASGQSKAIAAWLAMNVKRAGDELLLNLDLPAIRSILDDYDARDMWPEVAREDAARALHLVVGEASYVWREGDIARLEALAAEKASVHVHLLEGAGHWLNVDAPDALRALFVERLSRAT